MPLSQDRFYAYLTDSNTMANRLADDIIRLAPRPDVDEDHETTGMYLRTVEGRFYVLRPFIDDSRRSQFPPDEPQARFHLGIAVSHLEAFKDPEFYEPVPDTTVATVGIEGTILDERVVNKFGLPLEKRSKVKFPLRLRASVGAGDSDVIEDIFDIGAPGFEPFRASQAFLRGFFERWDIERLDRKHSWAIDANVIRVAQELAGPGAAPLPVVPKQETVLTEGPDGGAPYSEEDQYAWEESFADRTPPEEPWFDGVR